MKKLLIVILSILPLALVAQAENSGEKVTVVGALQHNGLFALEDEEIGASKPEYPYLSNSYLDLGIRSKYVSAGLRGELMLAPMPGYETNFKGGGLSNIWVKGEWKWGNITIGDVYGQFGSGFILRLYEERSLGVDNALRGGKLELTPYKGIRFQALGGKQRRYWEMYNDKAWGFNYKQDAVVGANLELQIDEWIPKMQETGANLMIGGSWVSKYQDMDTVLASSYVEGGYLYNQMYNLPKWVGAWDARANFQMNGWNALVEYAYKANDPCMQNHYNYDHGEAVMASLSYSRSGMSVIVQAKRSQNMAFRSDRQEIGIAGNINHLPAFANQHTYALAALYPYATQMETGEWAIQGEIRYTWKRKTKMGGKYGTTLKLNASHVRGIGETWFSSSKEAYYTDVNLELNKKLTKQWTLNAMLMYQTYNKQVVEGHGDLIRSGIAVADVKWAINSNVQMRAELQYLFTKQDEGQWLHALYELSLFKQLMLSFSDTYNIGGTEASKNLNYYQVNATYQKGAHRLMLGFGRTRAGYNCSGGVCRYVPAQKGVSLTYNFTW
ncbi:MAG: DUF6029 family protein [Paludibacteraceae bacterium]|nr:DUF6029 family protein [Paludibacteraceae bacterium]